MIKNIRLNKQHFNKYLRTTDKIILFFCMLKCCRDGVLYRHSDLHCNLPGKLVDNCCPFNSKHIPSALCSWSYTIHQND